MSLIDKVVTHSVDIQTSLKFQRNEKSKFRAWLKAHPNFKFQKDTGRWMHIYEDEAVQYMAHKEQQQETTGE